MYLHKRVEPVDEFCESKDAEDTEEPEDRDPIGRAAPAGLIEA